MNSMSVEYIIKYLDLVSNYSEKFHPLYLDRWKIQEVEWFDYSVHWIWILIKDFKNNIEIDFDYFRYEWKGIKYFELWKINQFIKAEWKIEPITKETWKELEDEWYIRQYFNSSYYSLTGKKKWLKVLNEI